MLGKILQQTTKTLNSGDIEDAHLEARILLGYVLEKSPVDLYTEPAHVVTQEQKMYLQQVIERRLKREPAAYIINRKEFYGIDFFVDNRVLIPRPETELFVSEALKFAQTHINSSTKPLIVADIGTGCGNIAITLALNVPKLKIYATDISASALEVARINCEYYKVTDRVILLQGNLLEPLPENMDLIVANLPYITTTELPKLSPEIRDFEPITALDGGKEGLDHVNHLLKQVREKLYHPCRLLLEIGAGQDQTTDILIKEHLPGASFKFIPDSNGIKRIVEINT
jgi:release factor glutamine methyltransferase